MARAIDGEELLGIERLLDTDVVRKNETASWLLDQVLHDIQAMPTLTPQNEAPVVHGKWGRVNEDRYRCDRCEQITTVDECMGKPNYNFCPNCSARMEGVSDG